jgi:hypothetical protein
MKQILLTQGQFALVDDEDFEQINKFKWYAQETTNRIGFYAAHTIRISKTSFKKIRMHRIIMNARPDQEIDHINHDTLDNQKNNLRFVSHSPIGILL